MLEPKDARNDEYSGVIGIYAALHAFAQVIPPVLRYAHVSYGIGWKNASNKAIWMHCTRPAERQELSKRGRHSISGMMSIDALPLFQKIERGKNWPDLLWPPPTASAMLFSSILVLLEERKTSMMHCSKRRGLRYRQHHLIYSWIVNTILLPLAIGLLCSYLAHWVR